ncbi:HNH endonuclease signature motif containing protein [Nocardioides daejeonensis]|uniref:HNH endonuclease signature motif containing protein n=1 Tax=Nocardioides daejeonensis TaxID=1046556 RepID=UPI000D741E82|nr:HNH endonuclease signature motif containing protein [Nocardioides daejeonensis]
MTTMMHPIGTAAGELRATLKGVSDANPTFLTTEEKAEVLHELSSARAQLDELLLRVMAAAGDLAASSGARDIASWMSHHTHQHPDDLRVDGRLAEGLDRRWPFLAAGMREGNVNRAQAQVIARALEAIPARLGNEVTEMAERHLVDQATRFGPRQLAKLGRKILHVIAPEIADEEEARRLAAEERDAWEKTRLALRAEGDGTTRLSARIPDAAAARLAAYLEAFTNPRKEPIRPDDPLRKQPYPRRLGWAFCAFLEHSDPHQMPVHGGDATTLVVTIGLDQLRQQLGTATIGAHLSGHPTDQITAAEARRLACTAQIIPAVLGGASEVLDLGRAQRLFTRAQRRALQLRDHTCVAEGCDIPGTWCEAHHWLSWAAGGPTDLDNAGLLCSHHHHRAHDPTYRAERLPNGGVRFHPRR